MMVLADKLCPWLGDPLTHLEQALGIDRLGHGWIFAGPAGTGKLNLALVFAARLLDPDRTQAMPPALSPDELIAALEERYLPQDHHPDLHLVWPDEGKRTIGIDRIREVIDRVTLTGYASRSKVVILEPAEWMTIQAANALLKALEEPSSGTHLILVSHSIGRLPATIRSRCQTLHVRRPPVQAQRQWLASDAFDEANPLLAGPGVGPVQAAQRCLNSEINKYNEIGGTLDLIYDRKIDVSSALDAWRELDTSLVLEWIADRLRSVIRLRVGARDRNSITDRDGALPHNPWRNLPTGRLFELLERTDQLRDLLGTGLNEPLAMQGILYGFVRS